MNNIKRLIVATFVAVLTALSITMAAQAGGPFDLAYRKSQAEPAIANIGQDLTYPIR